MNLGLACERMCSLLLSNSLLSYAVLVGELACIPDSQLVVTVSRTGHSMDMVTLQDR